MINLENIFQMRDKNTSCDSSLRMSMLHCFLTVSDWLNVLELPRGLIKTNTVHGGLLQVD